MRDVEPRATRHALEHAEVERQHEVAVNLLRHGVATGISGDGVEDARRAGVHRALAEVNEHIGDALQRRLHHFGVLAQVAHHARLGTANEVARHRQRAEHGLDDRDAGTELSRYEAYRFDLVVQGLRVDERQLLPRLHVRHRDLLQHRRLQAMAAWVIHRAERFGEAGRSKLKLHEVPAELPRSLDSNARELRGRPLLFEGVAPRAHRRPVAEPEGDRSLHPLAPSHGLSRV